MFSDVARIWLIIRLTESHKDNVLLVSAMVKEVFYMEYSFLLKIHFPRHRLYNDLFWKLDLPTV